MAGIVKISDRLVEEWRGGVTLRWNPTCEARLADHRECGKPATVRRNLWPYWSLFWCPKHAQLFGGPYLSSVAPTLDVPTFQRRAA